MLYTAQFRPNVVVYSERNLSAFHERFREHIGYKTVMAKHNITEPEDDGVMVLAKETSRMQLNARAPPKVPSTGNVLQVISLGKLPISGGDVMMRSPKSRASKALDGAFFVHQFSEPTQRYVSLSRTYDKKDSALRNVIFSAYEYIDTAGAYHLDDFHTVDGGTNCPDAEWYDMTWGMFIYTPGQLNPAIGGTPAELIIKTIYGIDAQPVGGSVLQAVAKDAPLYDQQALRLGAMMRQQMPDSLPASANDLGSIIATAIEWAPKIWNGIKSIFSTKKDTTGARIIEEAKAIIQGRVPRESAYRSQPARAPAPRRNNVRPSAPPQPPRRPRQRRNQRAASAPAQTQSHRSRSRTPRPPRLNPNAREFVPTQTYTNSRYAPVMSGGTPTLPNISNRDGAPVRN
jgi:hypothetical protein